MKTYREFINKPVLFLGFSYDVEDMYGNTYNVKEMIKKYVDSCEFSFLNNIHFFNGKVLNNETPLDNYSLVFIGPMGKSFENFTLVENYCKNKGIPIICYGSPSYLYNKHREMQLLAESGLKIPKTYTSIGKSCNSKFVTENFAYPFVLKTAHGSQGKGVNIVKNDKEFKTLLNKYENDDILIQEFIPNDCDYRVFFIEDQHIFNVKRTRKDKKEFRNNVSLGGSAERVDLDIEQLSLSKKAHKALKFYSSGVDLVQNKDTKEWYILEVNSAPQISVFDPDEVIQIFADKINKIRK